MSDNQNTDGSNNTNQNQNNDNNQNQNQNTDDQNKGGNDGGVDIAKLVQEKVDEQLKDIKGKLDKAYGARDDAMRKVAEFETQKKEAEIARLKEEGKHKEVYELQVTELNAKLSAAEKRNIELTRDMDVRNTLSAQPFRNDSAREMAYREIVGQLVQNEQGVWVHKSGSTIGEFVQSFADNDANSFLFKPKASSGSGDSGVNMNNNSSEKKSLFTMSQDEVLKMAREGKLRK